MTECATCPRPTEDWPAAECESPELHDGAIYDCDCGDTVTIAEAIDNPRKHRCCRLIGADLGSVTAIFLMLILAVCLGALAGAA